MSVSNFCVSNVVRIFLKQLPIVLKNDGQRIKKSSAMFSKTTGNVFYFYGQRFVKLWAMFCETMSHIFCMFVQPSEKC